MIQINFQGIFLEEKLKKLLDGDIKCNNLYKIIEITFYSYHYHYYFT